MVMVSAGIGLAMSAVLTVAAATLAGAAIALVTLRKPTAEPAEPA